MRNSVKVKSKSPSRRTNFPGKRKVSFFDMREDEEPMTKETLKDMYLKQEKEMEGSDFEDDNNSALFMGINEEDGECMDEPLIELPD